MNALETLDKLRRRDCRFLNEVMRIHDSELVAVIAEKWSESTTAWSRRESARYFQQLESAFGHELIVRRLIDRAVERKEIEVLAASAVFLDHASRRSVISRGCYVQNEWTRLQRPGPRPIRLPDARRWRDFKSLRSGFFGSNCELFSLSTRRHLQRKVWRRIREIAKDQLQGDSASEDKAGYVQCVSKLLRNTPEATVANHGSMLSAWCLMKSAFGMHPDLQWSSDRVVPKPARTLANLVQELPGSFYQELWQRDDGIHELERITSEAKTDLARAWAGRMLAILQTSSGASETAAKTL